MKLTANRPGTLLDWLIVELKDHSRTQIKKWLAHGCVSVNGRVQTRHDTALLPRDTVQISSFGLEKSPSGLRVLHEDASLLVVDKPAGLLTIATEKEKERTAYFEMNAYLKRSRGRVFIVHRLDRETSGLVVFAKTEEAKRKLQLTWEKTKKLYYAVVQGTLRTSADTISSHLSQNQALKVFSGEETRTSKYAVTKYRVLRRGKRFSLLEVEPVTGRKNQIRVHLADMGHPVAGDEKYGARAAERLALHAWKLSFVHPFTGKPVTFESPLPEELKRLAR